MAPVPWNAMRWLRGDPRVRPVETALIPTVLVGIESTERRSAAQSTPRGDRPVDPTDVMDGRIGSRGRLRASVRCHRSPEQRSRGRIRRSPRRRPEDMRAVGCGLALEAGCRRVGQRTGGPATRRKVARRVPRNRHRDAQRMGPSNRARTFRSGLRPPEAGPYGSLHRTRHRYRRRAETPRWTLDASSSSACSPRPWPRRQPPAAPTTAAPSRPTSADQHCGPAPGS